MPSKPTRTPSHGRNILPILLERLRRLSQDQGDDWVARASAPGAIQNDVQIDAGGDSLPLTNGARAFRPLWEATFGTDAGGWRLPLTRLRWLLSSTLRSEPRLEVTENLSGRKHHRTHDDPQRNIMLTLSYQGTNYCGWQIQPNGLSVQTCVEQAI